MSRPKDFFPTPEDIPPAVQWHEGMLLAPQHFQQQALLNEAQLHYHLRQISPFHWGIKRLEYDRRLLDKDGVLRVSALEAVMPDGLVVSFHQAKDMKLELVLDSTHKAALVKEPQIVHIVVLADKRSGAGANGLSSRYRESQSPPLYDEYSQDLPLQIQQLVPWLRLHLGEPRGDDCALPLLELSQRVAKESFRVSEYVAPWLCVPEDSELGQLCHEVAELLHKKIGHLRNVLTALSAEGDGFEQEVNRHLLTHLIAGLPAFEAVRKTGVCHPFTLYTALCTLAGHVAAVRQEPIPPTLVGYQHDQLRRCFDEMADFIRKSLEEGVPESFFVKRFKSEEKGFELTFSKKWLEHKLVLGVVGPERALAEEVKNWVKECSIGTARGMRARQGNRVLGVRREYSPRCPDLAPWSRMLLFELKPHPAEDKDLFNAEAEETLRIEHLLQGVRQEPHPAQIVLFISKEPRQGSNRAG